MLLTEDPQMQPIQTPFGTVSFLQVSANTYHCHYKGYVTGQRKHEAKY